LVNPVQYADEKSYVEDQLASFRAAIQVIKTQKKKYVFDTPDDFRGDKDKVLEAMSMSISFLEERLEEFKKDHVEVIMVPRKFLYEEREYFGSHVRIELTSLGLEVHECEGQILSGLEPLTIIKPTPEEWDNFRKDVVSLNLKPSDPTELITDGFEVTCCVLFSKRLLNFSIINPDFDNFDEFRQIVNRLTICKEFPDGVLLEEDADEDD